MGFALPPQVRAIIASVLLSFFATKAFAVEPLSLLPVPDAAAQAAAEKIIADAFKPYPPPRPADENALAIKLLEQGKDSANDAATRYVLFRDAAKFAAATSDLDTSIAAIDQIKKYFDANTRAMTVETIHKLATAASQPDAARSLLFPMLRISNAALKDHNLDLALEAANAADALLRTSKDSGMDAIVKEHRKTVSDIHAAYQTAIPAIDKLVKDPEDAAANLAAGKFYCFMSNQWDVGLPMLAKSSDAAIKQLVKEDLSAGTDPVSERHAGDGWWDFSRTQTGITKQGVLQRSAYLYARSLSSLEGLNKAVVQKRVDDANAGARQGMGRVMDLMPLVEVADATAGTWSIKAGELLSDNGGLSRIQLPYVPAAEYDFRIEFTRLQGNSCVTQICNGASHPFIYMIGLDNKFCGFETVKGIALTQNKTSVQIPNCIENNRRYTSVVQVRGGGIRAYLNGKLTTEYKTDFKDMANDYWGLTDSKVIGVGAHQSQVVFHSIVVIELSGSGKVTRSKG